MVWARLWPERCVGCQGPGGPVCERCAPDELHEVQLSVEGIHTSLVVEHYSEGLGAVVRQVKYRPDRRLGQHLATRLAEACYQHLDPSEVDAVVPAPSAAWTRFRRGFSLASILAHQVGARLHRPVIEALTLRGGRRQAGLSRRERASNLSGRVYSRREVPQRILLVDDVITTGATSQACAQALLQEGASRVWVVAACLADKQAQTGGHQR